MDKPTQPGNDDETPAARLLSIEQVIEALGVSRTTVYQLLVSGKLRSIKINRRRLIPREAIDELIAVLSKESERPA
jgi:excisionase family DNA binding protein